MNRNWCSLVLIQFIFTLKEDRFNRSKLPFSSVQFSRSVLSDSLQPHESQHARPPCPSPTPGVYSNSCPSSQWCCPAISSSVIPFSSCPQPLPASGSFPVRQVFVSTLHMRWPKYWSFSFSTSPSNEHPGLSSLQSKGLSRVFSNTTVQKHQYVGAQLSSQSNSHPYMITGKTIALTRQTFAGKVMFLLFNMLSRLVITFLPRSKRLNFMAAITICSDFGAPQNKVWHCFHCFPFYFPLSDGTRCHDFSFLNVEHAFL